MDCDRIIIETMARFNSSGVPRYYWRALVSKQAEDNDDNEWDMEVDR